MENRNDLQSILPFLPLSLRSSALFWPPSVVETLKSLANGPICSAVNSGQLFAGVISDLRKSLGFYALDSSASLGFSLFFDSLVSGDDAEKWFGDVVPRLADLLLRLPVLLERHYQNASIFDGRETGLRLLASQQPGIVFLSQLQVVCQYHQLVLYSNVCRIWRGDGRKKDTRHLRHEYKMFNELIAALLVCALFCLYPTTNRDAKNLPLINFDNLFLCLYECYGVNQEHKIKCLLHYFEKICLDMPMGNVSYERKVLPLMNSQSSIVYPGADFWSNSAMSLCQLEVRTSGLIEDQSTEVLEVDFANKYIGGGALNQGCVQEEIRFMINPELILGMLFLPSMADNEAIEIVGAERFSQYSGYAASFRFCGDFEDQKSVDARGRRRTRIIAIDALRWPGKRQYRLECFLRESNKAFCGFLDQEKTKQHQTLLEENGPFRTKADKIIANAPERSNQEILNPKDPSASFQADKLTSYEAMEMNEGQVHQCSHHEGGIGVATGNWGCGAFGGDPEVKVVIQWLAASQALRPFILYHTFGLEALQKLKLAVQWILSQGWSVGELWDILVEYSTRRLKGETTVGLFKWLLPSL